MDIVLPRRAVRSRSRAPISSLPCSRTDPVTAKTAACVIRYGNDEVVALLDSTQAGRTSQELLGIGGSIPVVGGLLSSLGGTKKRGAGRGRKPAVFGLLGAGAAGAGAAGWTSV